jgi:hypothetical protein
MAHQQFNLKQIRKILKFSLENCSEKVKLPVCITGVHGIGKTEFVAEIAKENGFNLVVLHLAMQDICDLIGIPSKIDITLPDGTIDSIQTWSCPKWLHDANENYLKTGTPNIFFLDEYNRANRFVLSAMLPFLIEGVLHQHRIGPKDAVLAAANPSNDNYEVNEITDKALLNRMGHVIFNPTHTEYVKFLEKKNIDAVTLNVVKSNIEYTKVPSISLGYDVTPSRRSIFNVMSIIGKKNNEWIEENASCIIEAYLGESFRDTWILQYKNTEKNITLHMLQDFDNNKDYIVDIITTTIDGTITHRSDILSKTIDIIKSHISDMNENITHNDIEWMVKFFSIDIIPDDACSAVFLANPIIKKMIMKDIKINSMLVEFLSNKKIINI